MAGYDWKDRFEDQYYDPQDSRYRERPVYPEQEEDRYYDRQSYDRRDRRDYYPQERYDAERDYYDRQRYDRKYYDDRPSYYPVDRDYSSRDRYEREDRDRLYQERRYYRDDDYRDDMYARYRRDDPRYDDRSYLRREPSYRDEYPTRPGRDARDQYRNPPRQEAAQGRRQGEALTEKQRSEIESFVLRLLAENNVDVTPAREEIPSIEHDTNDRRWQSVSDGSSVPSMPEYRETQAETHVVEPVIEPVIEPVVEHVVEPVIEEVPAPVVVKEPETTVLHEAEPSAAPEIEIEHIEIPAPPVPVEKTEEVKEQPALEAVEHIEAAAVEQGIVEVPEAAHEEKPAAEEITEPVIAASEGETNKIIDEPVEVEVVEQPEQEVIPEKVESPEISERKKATDDIIRKVTQAVIEKKKDVKEETPEPEKEEVCEPEQKESPVADYAPEINVDETVNELFSRFEGEQSEQNEPIHIPFDETEMRDLVSEIESEPKSSELDFALEAESDSGKEEYAATVAKVEEPVSEGISSDIKPETGSEIEAVDVAADTVAGTAAIAGIEQAIENVKEHMDDTPEEGLKQDIDSIEAALRDLIAKLRSGKEDAIKEFDTLEQESPETPELITDFGIEKAEDELHVEAAPAPETVVEEREDTVSESAPDNILTEDEDTLEDQTSTVHEEPVVQEEFAVQEEPVAQKEPDVLEETVVTEVTLSETSNSIDSEKTDSEPIPEEVKEEASSDNTEDVSEHAGEETIVEETSSATEVTIESEPKEEVSIEQEPQQETAEPVTAESLQTEMTERDLVAEASEERRRTEINELADTFEFTPISVDGQGNIYTSGGFNFDFGSEPVQNIPGQLRFEGNEVVEESDDTNDDQRLSFVLSEIDSIETSLLKGAVLELYEKQLLSPQTFTKDNCFEAENLVSDEVLRFGNSPMIRLFNDISFRIPKGARAAITGKEENSRAALTRTLGTGSGILSGTVKYSGKELNPKQWASSVMYIDSGDVISDSMTGVDFLMLCGIPQKTINTVLSRIGMAGIASRTADKMTDIQKVILLVVAGALSDSVSTIVINLNDTKVTEAEETCFALAGEYVTELGKTLIMNAFSRHCAATVCNYVVAIDNGSLAYEGDIKGFADAYGDDRLTFICKDEMLQELRDKLPEFVITSKSGLATLSGSFDREKLESILDIMLSEDIDLSKVSAEPRNFITATEGM